MSPVAVLVVVVMLACLAAVIDARGMQRAAEGAVRRAQEERDAAVVRASLAEGTEVWLSSRLADSERRRELAVRHARALRVAIRDAQAACSAVVPPTSPEAPALVPARAGVPVQPKRRRRPVYLPESAIDLTAREVERSTIGPVVRMCARKLWAPVMAHTERGVAPACWLVRRGIG